MTKGTLDKVRALLMLATFNNGNVDTLYGPSNAPVRAAAMSLITGRKVAKSNAGYGKFIVAVSDAFGIKLADCSCMNDRDEKLAAAIKGVAHVPAVVRHYERAKEFRGEEYARDIFPGAIPYVDLLARSFGGVITVPVALADSVFEVTRFNYDSREVNNGDGTTTIGFDSPADLSKFRSAMANNACAPA